MALGTPSAEPPIAKTAQYADIQSQRKAEIEKKAQQRSEAIAATAFDLENLGTGFGVDYKPWIREIDTILNDKSRPQAVNDVLAARAAYRKFQDLGATRNKELLNNPYNARTEMDNLWERMAEAEQNLRDEDPVEWNKLMQQEKDSHYSKLYAQEPRYMTKGDTQIPGLSVADKQLIAGALDNGWTGLSAFSPDEQQLLDSQGLPTMEEAVAAHQRAQQGPSGYSEVAEARLRNEYAHGLQKIALLREQGNEDGAKLAEREYGKLKEQADNIKAVRHKALSDQIVSARRALDRTDLPQMARSAGMQVLKNLEEQERGFLDPSYEFEKVVVDNKEEIAEASEPSDTPAQAMRKYLGSLLYEYKTLSERIGGGEGLLEGMNREIGGLTTRGWNADEKRLTELKQKIASVSRVVLLNEIPEKSTSAATGFKDSLTQTIWGSSTMGNLFDTNSQQGKALDVKEMLTAIGADEEAIVNPIYKERFKEAQEGPGWLSWEHAGELAGMLTGIGMQAGVGSGALKAAGAERVFASMLASPKVGRFGRVAIRALQKGAEYEVTGDLFKEQEHFFNFAAGVAGGLAGEATAGVLGGLGKVAKGGASQAVNAAGYASLYGKGVVRKMGRMVTNAFGNKADEAAQWIMANGKTLREMSTTLAGKGAEKVSQGVGSAVGQFAEGNIRAVEEIGGSPDMAGFINGLAEIFRSSDVRKEYISGLEQQFGTTFDERLGFFADMFFLGLAHGKHKGGIGDEAMKRAREIYEEMNPKDRRVADQVVESANELDAMHDDILARQGREQAPEGTVEAKAPDQVSPSEKIEQLGVSLELEDVNAANEGREPEKPKDKETGRPLEEGDPRLQQIRDIVEGRKAEAPKPEPTDLADPNAIGKPEPGSETGPMEEVRAEEAPTVEPEAIEEPVSGVENGVPPSTEPAAEAKPETKPERNILDELLRQFGAVVGLEDIGKLEREKEIPPKLYDDKGKELPRDKYNEAVRHIQDWIRETSKPPEPVATNEVPPTVPPVETTGGGGTPPPPKPPVVDPVQAPEFGQPDLGIMSTVTTLEKYAETNPQALNTTLKAMDRTYQKATHAEQYQKALSQLTGGREVTKGGKKTYELGEKNPLSMVRDLTSRKGRALEDFADVLAQRLVLTDIVGHYADGLAKQVGEITEKMGKETDPAKKAQMQSELETIKELQDDAHQAGLDITEALARQGTIGGQGTSFIGFWRNIYSHADGHLSMAIGKHNELIAKEKKPVSERTANDLNDIRETQGMETAEAVANSQAVEQTVKSRSARSKATKETIAREKSKRQESISQLKDLLKGPDMGQLRDVTTLAAELIGRGGEAALLLTKIGISLAKEGAVKFADWSARMREELRGTVEFTDEDLRTIHGMEHEGASPRSVAEEALERASMEPKEREARAKSLREQVRKELTSGDPADLKKRLMDNVGLSSSEADLVMEKGKSTTDKRLQEIADARDLEQQRAIGQKAREIEESRARELRQKTQAAITEHFSGDNIANKLESEGGLDKDTARDVAKIAKQRLIDGKAVTTEMLRSKIADATGLDGQALDGVLAIVNREKSMTLKQRLMDKAKLSDSEAQRIVDETKAEFDKRARAQVEARAKRLRTKPKPRRGGMRPTNDIDRALETLADREFDDATVNDIFTDRLGFVRPLTPAEAAQARALSGQLSNTRPGGILEHNAARHLDRFFDQFLPRDVSSGPWKGRKEAWDTWKSMYYAGMLSGLATSIKNVLSAATIVAFSPAQNIVNWSEWSRALREGRKAAEGEKLRTFARASPVTGAIVKYAAMGKSLGTARRTAADIFMNGYMGNKFMSAGESKLGRQMNILERRYFEELKKAGWKGALPWVYKYSGRALQAQDVFLRTMANEMQLADAFRKANVDKSRAYMAQYGFTGGSYASWVNFNMAMRNHPNYRAAVEKATEEVAEHEKAIGAKANPKQTKRFVNIRTRELLQDGFEHHGTTYKGLELTEKAREDAASIARSQIFTEQRGGLHSGFAEMVNKLKAYNPKGGFPLLDVLLTPFIPFTTIIGNLADTAGDYNPLTGISRANGGSVSELLKVGLGTTADGKPRFGSARMSERALDPNKTWLENRLSMESNDPKYYEQMGRAWTGIHTLLGLMAMTMGDQSKGLGITWDDDDDIRNNQSQGSNNFSVTWNGEKLFSYLDYPMISAPLAFVGAWHSYGRNPERFGDSRGFAARMAYAFYAMETAPTKMSIAESSLNAMNAVKESIDAYMDPSTNVGQASFDVLLKPWLKTVSKGLPWRTGMVEQAVGLWNPEKYSTRSMVESLEYFGAGSFYPLLRKATGTEAYQQVDIFGDPMPLNPIQHAIPFLNYFRDDVSNRPHVKWLNERGITFGTPQNDPVKWVDPELPLGITYKDYNSEEWDYFTHEAGKMFKEKLYGIMEDVKDHPEWDTELVEHYKKKMSLTEKKVSQALSAARRAARGMVQEKFGKKLPDGFEPVEAEYEGGTNYEGELFLD